MPDLQYLPTSSHRLRPMFSTWQLLDECGPQGRRCALDLYQPLGLPRIRISPPSQSAVYREAALAALSEYLNLDAPDPPCSDLGLRGALLLHIPPVLPTHIVQRVTDLPQRVGLHRFHQRFEHVAAFTGGVLEVA